VTFSVQGVWTRQSVSLDGGEPFETQHVYWLQAGDCYADVRVPFHPAGGTSCFAGRSGWDGDRFRWTHRLDFEAPPVADGTACSGGTGGTRLAGADGAASTGGGTGWAGGNVGDAGTGGVGADGTASTGGAGANGTAGTNGAASAGGAGADGTAGVGGPAGTSGAGTAAGGSGDDIGELRWDGDCLIETGMLGDVAYEEVWARLPDDGSEPEVL
jgi:hypothetical protein